MGQGKNHVEVIHRQEFCLTVFQPLCFHKHLTLGTMPVATGVVRIPLKPTMITFFDVATQVSGAADLKRMHHLQMRQGQGMLMVIFRSIFAEYICNF